MTLENADYGGAGESITYGNLTGRELLEEKHDQKERLKRVEDKLEKTNEEVADSKIQIASRSSHYLLRDIVKSDTDSSRYIAEISWRTLIGKGVRKSAMVMKPLIAATRLPMQIFTPPANDMTRRF